MSDDRRTDPVQRLFTMFADHLEAWLAGDELALERLGEAIQEACQEESQEGGIGEDHLNTALLTLRRLAGAPEAGVAGLHDVLKFGAGDGELAH